MEYSMSRADVGENPYGPVFEFMPENHILSGYLFTDSRMIFGQRFEKFDEIMKLENYEAGGNAYDIEMRSDDVEITCTVDSEKEESVSISREEFVWIMKEWIKENRDADVGAEVINEKAIAEMDASGIRLKNGYHISFSDCSRKWNRIKGCETKCIGERDITAQYPYFVFYTDHMNIRIEIHCLFKRKTFNKIRQHIEACGYTTFDMS